MVSERRVESLVGVFLLAAIIALLVLAFKVSGLTSFFKPDGYDVTAQFDDIGSLKVRSAVKIDGVLVGEVASIVLDPASYKAVVTLRINSHFNTIPDDSSVSILTAGLLGDNYIAINPMYSQVYLKNGSEIQDTHSAMILEKLIGQMIYKMSNTDKPAEAGNALTPAPVPPAIPGARTPNKAMPAPNSDANPDDNQNQDPDVVPKKPAHKERQPQVEISYEQFV
jgi:phospholipid/cholesterol/gamma-HCH transport system substrate-binding protein